MAKVYLKNAGVNSGTSVWLTETNGKIGFKAVTKADPSDGKEDIVEASRSTIENPLFTVSGVIDVDNIPTNGITYSLLKDFIKETSYDTYLQIAVGDTDVYLDGFDENPDSETNWIRVQIMNINIVFDSNSEKGHYINYTITFRETK